MKSTLGEPSFARKGSGHAGDETSNVRPMTPLKADPGLYSLSATLLLLLDEDRLDIAIVFVRLRLPHFLDVLEPPRTGDQLEDNARPGEGRLHHGEQSWKPLRPHTIAELLLARPVLDISKTRGTSGLGRQRQRPGDAAMSRMGRDDEGPERLEEPPRLAAYHWERHREANHAGAGAPNIPGREERQQTR